MKPAESGVHSVSETPSGGRLSRFIFAACPALYACHWCRESRTIERVHDEDDEGRLIKCGTRTAVATSTQDLTEPYGQHFLCRL